MTSNVTPLPRPRRQSTGPFALEGTLALDLGLETMPPFPAAPAPVPASAGAAPLPLLRGADSVPISAAQREEVHRWAALFVQACVEAILGQRPVSQLIRWTTPEIHQELLARAATVAAAASGGSAGPRRSRRLHPRPLVSSVHSCFLATDRVEISIVVSHAVRSRCVAARMEKVAGRWRCTQIMFG